MNDIKWIHELVLGALLSNIVIFFSFLRFAWSIIKGVEAFKHRHRLMWLNYCKQNKIHPGRDYDRANDDSGA